MRGGRAGPEPGRSRRSLPRRAVVAICPGRSPGSWGESWRQTSGDSLGGGPSDVGHTVRTAQLSRPRAVADPGWRLTFPDATLSCDWTERASTERRVQWCARRTIAARVERPAPQLQWRDRGRFSRHFPFHPDGYRFTRPGTWAADFRAGGVPRPLAVRQLAPSTRRSELGAGGRGPALCRPDGAGRSRSGDRCLVGLGRAQAWRSLPLAGPRCAAQAGYEKRPTLHAGVGREAT